MHWAGLFVRFSGNFFLLSHYCPSHFFSAPALLQTRAVAAFVLSVRYGQGKCKAGGPRRANMEQRLHKRGFCVLRQLPGDAVLVLLKPPCAKRNTPREGEEANSHSAVPENLWTLRKVSYHPRAWAGVERPVGCLVCTVLHSQPAQRGWPAPLFYLTETRMGILGNKKTERPNIRGAAVQPSYITRYARAICIAASWLPASR
jgi:hypothetical protein